jgi:hypothetical protein
MPDFEHWINPKTQLKHTTYNDPRMGWCYRIEMILPVIGKQIYCLQAFIEEPSEEMKKRYIIESEERLSKLARLEYIRYCRKTK